MIAHTKSAPPDNIVGKLYDDSYKSVKIRLKRESLYDFSYKTALYTLYTVNHCTRCVTPSRLDPSATIYDDERSHVGCE